MRLYVLLALLSFTFMNAQDSTSVRKNEIRLDVLSLVASSKINISYERFLNDRFSTGVSANYGNSKKTNDNFDNGYRNTIPKYEIVPYLRYNLSKGISSFYFAEIFMSANGGDFKETIRLVDDNNNGYYVNQKSNYFDLAAGGGLGYKIYFKRKFAVEFLVGFGKNLINIDKSPDVISRVGLNFGYRF